MTQEYSVPSNNEPSSFEQEVNAHLKRIEGHLQAIRNMLTFFTGLIALALILQFIAALFGGL